MKGKILTVLCLLLSHLSFAQIKSFSYTDVKNYDDISDCVVLVNKTSSKIFEATLYGIKERDCPDGFVLSEFAHKNEDGTYTISPKAEKIAVFRGEKAGKSSKVDMDNQRAFKRYSYFFVYVSEPEEFKFAITDMREKRSDLYLYLEGTGREKEVIVQKEYVYVETPSASASAPSYSSSPSYPAPSATSSSSSGADQLLDALKKANNQLSEWSQGKCSTCGGTGVCSYCKGSGKSFGADCWSCKGTGKCASCGGDGDWIH